MAGETPELQTETASVRTALPAWAQRLAPALAGNAGRVHEAAFEWMRNFGRLPPEGLAPAAVLVALLDRDAGPAVLFTRRQDALLQHAGQVAFPGGGAEPSDRDPEQTALREAREEVGLPPEHVRVLGRLPRYPTTSAYVVTPVVGCVVGFSDFVVQQREVADIFAVPFRVLLDDTRWLDRPLEHNGKRLWLPELTWEGRRIWGATAGMLRSLLLPLREAWRDGR